MTGNISDASTAMMEITTNISTSVNP